MSPSGTIAFPAPSVQPIATTLSGVAAQNSRVFLPMSLAWVVIVAFLAKFEVFGGFWARWTIGG